MTDENTRQQRRAAARKAQKRTAAQPPAPPARPTTPPPAFELPVAARARWLERAAALKPEEVSDDPRVRTLLHEAPLVANFVERYWQPTVDRYSKAVTLPGLESASKRLPRTVSTDIRELTVLTREAHDAWIRDAAPSAGDPVARGWFVLGEIQSALTFLFDDGVEDERDAQLARVREAHASDGTSVEDLASALDDYAAVARPCAAELHGVGGFDEAIIAEATAIAAALRERPDQRAEAARGSRASIELRNRYAALLAARVADVRAAARFVFRHHPKVAQEAGSASERARRAASRRKKAAKPDAPPADPK